MSRGCFIQSDAESIVSDICCNTDIEDLEFMLECIQQKIKERLQKLQQEKGEEDEADEIMLEKEEK